MRTHSLESIAQSVRERERAQYSILIHVIRFHLLEPLKKTTTPNNKLARPHKSRREMKMQRHLLFDDLRKTEIHTILLKNINATNEYEKEKKSPLRHNSLRII